MRPSSSAKSSTSTLEQLIGDHLIQLSRGFVENRQLRPRARASRRQSLV